MKSELNLSILPFEKVIDLSEIEKVMILDIQLIQKIENNFGIKFKTDINFHLKKTINFYRALLVSFI